MSIHTEELDSESDRITKKDVADLLGVSRRTVSSYVEKGKLSPCYKDSFGKIYFEKSAVLSFKNTHKFKRAGKPMNYSLPPRYSYEEMKVIEKWQVQPKDVSSLDVQIGLLTRKIEDIEDRLKVLQDDEMDFMMLRMHLLKVTSERRKSLDLLRSTDTIRYKRALEKTGLNV